MNDKKQRSDARNSDSTILSMMYTYGVDMDVFVKLIDESKIDCWNEHIIHSGLTKKEVITMLMIQCDKK